MKAYKKILILSLCVTMLFSIMTLGSFGTYAADEDDNITLYLDCSNVYTVKADTVGGLFFYKSRDQIYLTATLDESGLFRFEVPFAGDLEGMWFRCNVEKVSMTVIMEAYNWNYIPNAKLLDGMYLTGLVEDTLLFEPSFSAGIWGDYATGVLIGDMDKNGELNVKDATFIQKCLADIENWEDIGEVLPSGLVRYMADFNLDGERNVKDATLIQKYVAY